MTADQAAQITAAASAASALAIIVFVWQAVLARNQGSEERKEAHEDHERSRREKAIDLLFEWAKSANEIGSDARRFCQKLNFAQIQALCDFKDKPESPAITIDATNRRFLERALTGLAKTDSGVVTTDTNSITLKPEEMLHIRWNLISYFNLKEAILSAWEHDTADKRMIEDEFRFLYQKQDAFNLIMYYRDATTNACPSLSHFAEEMHLRLVEEEKKRDEKLKAEEAERERRRLEGFERLGNSDTEQRKKGVVKADA